MFGRIAAGIAALAVLASGPAQAKDLVFTSALRGDKEPTVTGSKATGQAQIVVNTDAQTVAVTLEVLGLTTDELSRSLKRTPMGPIHMHLYASHHHAASAEAALVFPLPYGPEYTGTTAGFRVATKGVAYDKGAALVNTQANFAEFVAALESGKVVLNIHTNRFGEGEIAGDVVAAK